MGTAAPLLAAFLWPGLAAADTPGAGGEGRGGEGRGGGGEGGTGHDLCYVTSLEVSALQQEDMGCTMLYTNFLSCM